MDINEFRKQYPQYNNVDDFQLSERLREKFYPQVDQRDFLNKFMGKPGVMDHVKSDINSLISGAATTVMGVPKGLVEIGMAGANKAFGTQFDPENDWLVQQVQAAQDATRGFFNADPRLHPIETGIAEGVGQVGAMIGTAFVPGGQTRVFGGGVGTAKAGGVLRNVETGTTLGRVMPLGMGVTMTADEGFQDALMHDASPEQRDGAILWGAVMGTTDALPIFSWLDRMGGKGTGSRLLNMLKQGGIQALQEGVQELGQEAGLNWYAQLTYDEQRALSEDLDHAFAVGGGVGAIIGVISGAFMPKGVSRKMKQNLLEDAFGKERAKDILDRADGMKEVPLHEVSDAQTASKDGWEFFPFGNEETSVFKDEKRARFTAAGLGAEVVKVGDNYFLGRKGDAETAIDPFVSGERQPGILVENLTTPQTGEAVAPTMGVSALRSYLIDQRDQSKSKMTDEEIDTGLKLVNIYSAALGMNPDDFVNNYLHVREPQAPIVEEAASLRSKIEQSDSLEQGDVIDLDSRRPKDEVVPNADAEFMRSRFDRFIPQDDLTRRRIERDQARTGPTDLYQDQTPMWSSRLFETVQKMMGSKEQKPDVVASRLVGGWQNHFKKEELEWSGVVDWLNLMAREKRTVTKQEVLDYLITNGVQLTEVVKEENPETDSATATRFQVEEMNLNTLVEISEYAYMQRTKQTREFAREIIKSHLNAIRSGVPSDVWAETVAQDVGMPVADALTLYEQQKKVNELSDDLIYRNNQNATNWDSLTLPDGDVGTYREMLLTLPFRSLEETFETQNEIAQQFYGVSFDELTSTEREDVRTELASSKGQAYYSGHWQEPNVLAHVRFDERDLGDGKKTLFIHEIQSDWHQDGSKKGYRGKPVTALPPGYKVQEIGGGPGARLASYAVFKDGVQMANASDTRRGAIELALTKLNAGGVPQAPFKGREWVNLSMKRMFAHAVENNLDQVAWPGIAQQVAEIEGWGEVGQVDGKWRIIGSRQDVTPIVEQYLTHIPKFVQRYGDQYGLKLTRKMSSVGSVYVAEISSEGAQKIRQGQPLFQAQRKANGAVQFTPDGRALVRLFEQANFSTIVHEFGHVFRRTLPENEQAVLREVYDLKDGVWTVKAEEHFARAFERYIRKGKAPNSQVAEVFEKFKTFMRRVYASVKGSPIAVKIDPRVEAIFNKMMTPGALNTTKQPYEMNLELFKIIYGEDLAAINGVTGEVYGVPTPDRVSQMVIQAESHKLHRTPEELAKILPIVNDPAFLEPARLRSMGDVDRLNRLTTWAISNAQESYYRGDLERLKMLQTNLNKAVGNYASTAYDTNMLNDMQRSVEYMTELLQALDEVHYFRNTPARQQLLDLNREDGQQHLMHRETGEIYRIEGVDGKNVKIINLSTVKEYTMTKDKVARLFVSPELIDPYSGDLLSKDEWLMEQHYAALVKAIDEGQQVPNEALEAHLNRDPSFQRLFDRNVEEQKKESIGEENLKQNQEDLPEKMRRIAHEDPSISTVDFKKVIEDNNLDGPQAEIVELIGNAINEASYALTRLTNVFLHHGQIRFLDLVAKKDVHMLSKLRRSERPLQTQEYMAHMLSELDVYQNMLELHTKELLDSREQKVAVVARVLELRNGVMAWHNEFQNQALEHLLEPSPEINKVYDAWKAMRYNLVGLMPKERSKSFWFFWDKMHTMQWKARRFPVMQKLFRAGSIERTERATGVYNIFMNGKELPDQQVEFEGPKGVKIKKTLKNPGLQTFMDIDANSPEYATLYKLLWGGDFWEARYTPEQILAGEAKSPINEAIDISHLTPDQQGRVLKAYEEVRDSMDLQYFYIRQMVYDNFGNKKGDTLMKKLYPKGFIEGYMPHIWEGEYAFFVKNKDGETVYLAAYETPKGRNAAMEEKRAQLKATGESYIIDTVDRDGTREPAMYNAAELNNAIGAIISEANIPDITGDPEVARRIEAALDDAALSIMKQHGIHALYAKRKGTLGFDDRMHRVISSRVQQLSSAVSKIEFARKGVQELGKIHSSLPQMTRDAQEWYKIQMESSDKWDNMVARFRSLLFFRYLGFNVKTAFVIVMDKITNAPAILGTYTGKSTAKILAGIPRTVKLKTWLRSNIVPLMEQGMTFNEALEAVQLPDGFSKDAILALHAQQVGGVTSARFTQEISAIDELMGMRELKRAKQLGMEVGIGPGSREVTKAKLATEMGERAITRMFLWSTKMIEIMETLGRESTFLTAYETLRKEKNWDYDRAVKVAQDVMINSHYMYGKPNLPLWSVRKGMTRVARPVLTFRTFELNYLQMVADLMFGGRGKVGRRNAMKSLAFLMLLGGGYAAPFFTTLLTVLGWATGDDYEQILANKMDEIDDSEFLSTLVSHGIPGLAGVTLRGSMQVGAYQNPIDAVAGVAGSYGQDVSRAAELAMYGGNWGEAMAKLVMPIALLDNPMAAKHSFDGHPYLTRGGSVLRDKEFQEIYLTPREAALKGLGFQPSRVADTQRLESAMRTEAKYYSAQRSDIYKQIKVAVRTDDDEMLSKAFDRVRTYNERIADVPGESVITRDAIRNSLREAGLKRSEIIRKLRLSGQL